tara:strand:+ start:284 stop:715 length:432 start_codon:yes stop_codon:yes gene_type:complete
MAKALFDKNINGLYKVCTNDNINNYNTDLGMYNVVDISDDNFASITKELKTITYDGTTVSYADAVPNFSTEASLKVVISNRVFQITDFCRECNQSNPLYNGILAYKEALEGIDTSSISYPLEKSLEQYCEENSITYYHPLQIP